MHELSIVLSIVDLAEEQVRKNNAQRVENIELDIGSMAGVEWDALDFAWTAGVKNSVLENAHRQVNRITALARCLQCQHEFEITQPFEPCPACHDYLVEYIQGKELRVKSLTVS